jgi:hypothetical protein
MNTKLELEAFDKLPPELRKILNYIPDAIDPRYILGMFTQQGLDNTINYLDSIGVLEDV